jgi:hypothetical protein
MSDIDRHRSQRIIGTCLCVVLGTMGVAGAIWGLACVPVLYADASRAEARVTNLECVNFALAGTPDAPGGGVFSDEIPVVRFQDGQRQVETRIKNVCHPVGKFSVGQKVTVAYRTAKPEEARIPSFKEFFVPPLFMGFIGIVFQTVGIVFFRRSTVCRERGRQASDQPPNQLSNSN